jgi:hypothetical protein
MHSAANSRKSIGGSQPSNVILSFFPGIPSASALEKTRADLIRADLP